MRRNRKGGYEAGLPALFNHCSEHGLWWEWGGTAQWPSRRLTQKLIEILSVFCNDVLFVMGVEHRPRLKLTRNQSQDDGEEEGRVGVVEVMHLDKDATKQKDISK